MKNTITIIAQAFYGNRTGTEVPRDEIDAFILGWQDVSLMPKSERIDRTIVRIPGTENLVLVYNRYQEEERLLEKDHAYRKSGYVIKSVATVPELELEIYSRCIACRVNSADELESLKDGDFKKLVKYLAE